MTDSPPDTTKSLLRQAKRLIKSIKDDLDNMVYHQGPTQPVFKIPQVQELEDLATRTLSLRITLERAITKRKKAMQ